jgi:hypothetical protein
MKNTYLILIIAILFFAKCEKPEKFISVKTGTSSDVAATKAKISGEIVDYGDGVNDHGHCWSATSENPSLEANDSKSNLGSMNTIGEFTTDISGLLPSTTYYIRAYAKGKGGEVYGNTISFTTASHEPPTLTTIEISSITQISAKSGGNITYDGNATVTAHGVCWGTETNPDINANKTSDVGGDGIYTSDISGLNANTTYFVRAYATNTAGTAYGNEISFITSPGIATVTTATATSISATTATSGGNVTNEGGTVVTARGVCWNTSTEPTIGNNKTTDGAGTGSFTSNLTDLSANTTYYARAYATNGVGTAYGSEISFTTQAGAPTVSTAAISNIATTSASGGGEVTNDGGAAVTARGVCWSTSTNPTIADIKTANGTGAGVFTSSLSSLTGGTTYYVKAYATNSIGTGYGEEVTFKTTTNTISILTKDISNITAISATSGGIITGTGTVTDKGLCYSDYPNPTTADKKVSAGTGLTSFNAALTILIPNKTYYVRAYATNSIGTVYGDEKTFSAADAYYEGFETGTGGFSTGAWQLVSGQLIEGVQCLYSIQGNSKVTFTRTLASDGQICFYSKNNDPSFSNPSIRFYIDDVEQSQTSNLSWQLNCYPVNAGTHTFKWVHISGSTYSGAVWLDYIVMPK